MAGQVLKPGQILKPRGERIVAALDVGSSKVAAIIAKVDGDHPPRVLGTGMRVSNGLRRGLVSDMEKAENAIRNAVDQAERAANISIDSVLVNLSAGALASDVLTVDINIAGKLVTDADIQTLLDDACNKIDEMLESGARSALHAEPTLYSIDGSIVNEPRGFHAENLAVDVHVLTAATPPCRNIDTAVRRAHLDVESIVASGVASSLAVLNPEERELGVAVVEIGSGITTVAVYGMGALAGMVTIPMGAGDITADIAASFATRRSAAERMKTLQGSAVQASSDRLHMIEVPPRDVDDGQENRRISRAELIEVIRSRLSMLFADVDSALCAMGFAGPAGRQVVLTGGGAELRGIVDFAQTALNRNVRLGRPRGLIGLPDAHNTGAFSTLAGLVLHANQPRLDLAPRRGGASRGGAVGPKPKNAFLRIVDSLFRQS